MRTAHAFRGVGAIWVFLALAGLARGEDIRCVVCGDATQGGQAVILGDQAYAVHEFGCLPIWQRAEKLGMLRDIDRRLEPGDALFQSPELAASDPTGQVERGSARVWAAFLFAACLLSGSLATLFALLTNRRRGLAFLLGFFLPAVGMVLVPVLPERSRRTGASAAQEGGAS